MDFTDYQKYWKSEAFIQSICGNIDIMYLLKTNVRKVEHFGVKKLPLFYKEVLCKTIVPLHVLRTEDFLQQPIWSNVYFQSNGKPLFFIIG